MRLFNWHPGFVCAAALLCSSGPVVAADFKVSPCIQTANPESLLGT